MVKVMDMTKDMITADDPNAELCTDGGSVEHDYRSFEYENPPGTPRISLRCVWCHVVACGEFAEPDPCIEPFHHKGPHRTKLGIYWPIGGTRPSPRERAR